ncbi:hypothetical protein ACWERV_27035 [Streptomyces sp. NPDC004031]
MTEPTHRTTYNGPVFNQHGETNIGINHGGVGRAPDAELRAAVGQLATALLAVAAHLTPAQSRTVEEVRPVLVTDRAAMTANRPALERLGRVAAAVGPLAEPMAAALARLLALLG